MTPREIEKAGVIPPGFREQHPGAHFCADWDFMLIWKDTPEWDACLCAVKKLPDPDGSVIAPGNAKADMRYSHEIGDGEYDIIINQPVAQECLSAGCQCGYKDDEIERLREALGETVTTLDLVWNHWNELGYDSKKIGARVRAILSDSAPVGNGE